jgi:hypothetical protein
VKKKVQSFKRSCSLSRLLLIISERKQAFCVAAYDSVHYVTSQMKLHLTDIRGCTNDEHAAGELISLYFLIERH